MALGLGQRRSGQLPEEVTGFVGRREELARVGSLLETARLITVTGPGGVGKTRVALRAGAAAASRFTDGVCLAELSGLRDPELLPHTIATCLGLPEQDARSELDTVVGYLRDRKLLLILDTCEHLLDACALLTDVVLREAGGVTVLATSRQPLDVPGEHTFPVPPMPVSGAGRGGDGDAIELFAERAAAAVPGFTITPGSHEHVVRLCRRLDGIPLAIELAAVRLRAVPLDQLTDRLENRFRVLTGGNRSLPRHQTLRTAIEWSYDLCDPAERMLWERVSVFAGSFDVASAEQVCADEELPREAIIEALIGLVEKSVLLRTGTGGSRYRLLDTLREFGAGLLSASGGGDRLRSRHIARYLELASYFGEHLLDDDQMPRFHALTREHANLRAALDYALTLDGAEREAAGLATSLWGYWQISGQYREGGYWLGKVLERFPEPSSPRAWALLIRGYLRTFQGEVDSALTDLGDGIAMAGQLGERRAAARGYVYLNLALTFAGRYLEAHAAGAEASRRLGALGDHIGLCTLDPQMGHLHQLAGELDQAIGRCAAGLDRRGAGSGERWLQSYGHLGSGLALFQMPDRREDCLSAVITALRMKHELGDQVGMAYALEVLAWLAQPERTAWLLGAADALWRPAGSRLSGQASMEEQHQAAERAARSALGDDRFAALWDQGGAEPLDQVVEHATDDAAWLRSAVPRPVPARRDDPLTSREREIAGLIAEGLSNREIAARLVISKRTVDAHVEHIFAKIGISSRARLASWLREVPAG